MPKHLKDRVLDDIPGDIVDAIATEADATDLDSLKAFLIEKKHPIVAEWKTKEEAKVKVAKKATPAAPAAPVPAAAPVALPAAGMMPAGIPMPVAGMSAGSGGGIKIILKNAKINIEQVIVEQVEE
jgi:acetyl-CoA decarbonylase/synthase complex subunit beta